MACWVLASFDLGAKKLDKCGRGLALSPAFFAEPFGQNDAVCFVEVTLQPAVAALDALAFLPEAMCLVGIMWKKASSMHLLCTNPCPLLH